VPSIDYNLLEKPFSGKASKLTYFGIGGKMQKYLIFDKISRE
jgi:hypothetical protein